MICNVHHCDHNLLLMVIVITEFVWGLSQLCYQLLESSFVMLWSYTIILVAAGYFIRVCLYFRACDHCIKVISWPQSEPQIQFRLDMQ